MPAKYSVNQEKTDMATGFTKGGAKADLNKEKDTSASTEVCAIVAKTWKQNFQLSIR